MLQFHTKTEIKPPRGFWLNLWGLSYIQLSMQLQAHQEGNLFHLVSPPSSLRGPHAHSRKGGLKLTDLRTNRDGLRSVPSLGVAASVQVQRQIHWLLT
eukprot:CAMPEP_0194526328 /NCGR_PEP_ID=MMETSP0253-20130528/62106_1 /TAXON_ID=2966 /ORGANISM="Noctiluca scintillans" /LENGTH=97 /DNA_ID=CAMNT_0039371147 /DNA_START=164 /DNA_END=455 /DNA_ORIENTATION=+